MRSRLTQSLWLGASVLPALLLWLWLHPLSPSRAPSRTMPLPERNIRNDRTNRIDLETPKTDRSTVHPAGASVNSSPWDSLQRGRYAEARDQLRLMGCPEETIQDLLLMRIVGSHHDAWVRQLRAEAALQPWWRPQPQQYNSET